MTQDEEFKQFVVKMRDGAQAIEYGRIGFWGLVPEVKRMLLKYPEDCVERRLLRVYIQIADLAGNERPYESRARMLSELLLDFFLYPEEERAKFKEAQK